MCLAQFASYYTLTSRVPAKVEFDDNGASRTTSSSVIFGSDTQLPNYVKSNGGKFFRLRQHPLVIRTHQPKRKEGHEKHFTLLLLIIIRRNESEDLFRQFPEK